MQTALRINAFSAFTLLACVACSSAEPAPGYVPPPAGGASGGGQAGGGASAGGGMAGGAAGLAGAGTNAGGASGTAGASTGGASGSAGLGGSAGVGGSSGSGGSGGAVSGCNGVTATFCDDFEAQTSGQAPVGAFDVDSGIVVDATKAYSGTQAVHLTGADEKYLTFTEQFPVNDYHGRAMIFITEVPQEDFHWDIITSQADNPPDNNYWEIGGMFQEFLFIVDPPDDGVSAGPPPAGEWFCLQWQFKYGGEGQPNTFVAKKNGVALPNGEFTGPDSNGLSWDAGPWQNLKVGWVAYGGGGSIEYWLDDLAFGPQEIACPTPP